MQGLAPPRVQSAFSPRKAPLVHLSSSRHFVIPKSGRTALVAALGLVGLVSGSSLAIAAPESSSTTKKWAATAWRGQTTARPAVKQTATTSWNAQNVTRPDVRQPTAPKVVPSLQGSATVGSAAYAVPAGAVFVATTGSDSNAGSAAAPKRTIGAAVAAAPAHGTVVLRGGVYHESVTIPAAKPLTVQAYPQEAVWMDGTRVVRGFVRQGAGWTAPWDVVLDSSPTFSWGAPDNTALYWQFVNPSHPMAAHPDMVWVGGSELRQVGALSQLTAGTFFVDRSSKKLHLGSDPTGKEVRSSDLPRAFNIAAPNTTIRGLGVRRFASSVPHQGVITARGTSFRLENVAVQDSATGAVGVFGKNSILNRVTITGSGQLGVQGHQADNFTMTDSVIRGSNDERFNQMPAAGALKLTSTRGIRFAGNEISGGIGNGFWADMACYDITLTNNTVSGNTGRGIFLELSSKAVVADNLIVNNADGGLVARQTDRVQVWNNTIVGVSKALDFSQDSRTHATARDARDSRRPFPDPDMPWLIGNSTIGNNVLQSQKAFFSVEDYNRKIDANKAGFHVNGNVYSAPSKLVPWWMIVWSRTGTDPAVYDSPVAFASKQGQERSSLLVSGASAVDGSYALVGAAKTKEALIAQPLPAEVATKVGQAAGTKHVGHWR